MGEYSLQITPEAEADIDEAYEYIAYHLENPLTQTPNFQLPTPSLYLVYYTCRTQECADPIARRREPSRR